VFTQKPVTDLSRKAVITLAMPLAVATCHQMS